MKRSLEALLIQWKDGKQPLPLLLRGARQVGKSFLATEFGKKYFQDLAIIDFEQKPEFKSIFSSKDPKEIILKMEFALKQRIIPGKTLIFLDEIQECPDALLALRYFKEQMPTQHVIAAGSLLEFLIHDENFSFPLGRVDFLYLRPFSFFEFLEAVDPFVTSYIYEFSLNKTPDELQHKTLLNLVRRYLLIGGMPDAIKSSLSEASLFECVKVQNRLLQSYESDFRKYAPFTKHRLLNLIFQKAPSLVAQNLKYSRLDPDHRSRELKPALNLLFHTGLLKPCYFSSASGIPLHAYIKEDKFKLYFLDVGLLQAATKIDPMILLEEEITQINAGMIAEQFVAQEIITYSDPTTNSQLIFWETEKGGQAEVDFVISHRNHIIPLEVKSGSTGSLRSLKSFMLQKKSPLGIRISEHGLSFHDGVLSVPFYLIKKIPDLIDQALMISKK
jgi:predicted AAA+ superfamily ATPase